MNHRSQTPALLPAGELAWERNPGGRHRRIVSSRAEYCSSRDWGGGLGAGGGGDRGQGTWQAGAVDDFVVFGRSMGFSQAAIELQVSFALLL